MAPMFHVVAVSIMGDDLRVKKTDVLPAWGLSVVIAQAVGHPDELGSGPGLRIGAQLTGVSHEFAQLVLSDAGAREPPV